jgi:hypothetical protein
MDSAIYPAQGKASEEDLLIADLLRELDEVATVEPEQMVIGEVATRQEISLLDGYISFREPGQPNPGSRMPPPRIAPAEIMRPINGKADLDQTLRENRDERMQKSVFLVLKPKKYNLVDDAESSTGTAIHIYLSQGRILKFRGLDSDIICSERLKNYAQAEVPNMEGWFYFVP